MEPTYGHGYILLCAMPVPGDDGRWKRAVIDVKAGETAYLPGSTKRYVHGPARLQYDVHPTGILLKHV